MIYLSDFKFPDIGAEEQFINDQKRTCYDTWYPFQVLSRNGLESLTFEPVTVLYGGNGSGKSTALNIIAEKLHLERDSLYNRAAFTKDFVDMCSFFLEEELPRSSRIITSDDVFDFMLNLRSINNGVDLRRDELLDEYMDAKYRKFQMRSLDDYEQLKKVNLARSKTQSKFVRAQLPKNLREHSNGESSNLYFQEKMQQPGLYLLDEPENSLSPARQRELVAFLQEEVRFFDCQLIIATHSPFILSMSGARIYDLDACPVDIKRWNELDSVREYYDFFMEHRREFE